MKLAHIRNGSLIRSYPQNKGWVDPIVAEAATTPEELKAFTLDVLLT